MCTVVACTASHSHTTLINTMFSHKASDKTITVQVQPVSLAANTILLSKSFHHKIITFHKNIGEGIGFKVKLAKPIS